MKQYNETRVNLSNVVVYSEKTETVDGKESTTYTAKKAKNEDGTEYVVTEVLVNVVEKKANEIAEFQKKQGWPEVVIDKVQTFGYREPEKQDEQIPMLIEAGLDPEKAAEVANDIFNRGWVLAQQKEGRDFMLKNDAIEGVYDLLKDAATPAERRKADPMTKLGGVLKQLGLTNISPAQLVEMIKNFQTQEVGA